MSQNRDAALLWTPWAAAAAHAYERERGRHGGKEPRAKDVTVEAVLPSSFGSYLASASPPLPSHVGRPV
jgi:hypothetical protein